MKIILTVGPPGCGKTTWAKEYLKTHKAKRLNRDDLRATMQNDIYNQADEKVIKRIRNYAIESWLNKGYDVIIDDTNLNPDVFEAMIEIAVRIGDVEVTEKLFKIDYDSCWNNNLNRTRSVPPEAWNDLWVKYKTFESHDDFYALPTDYALEAFQNEYKISSLPKAFIVDLDRTLALHVHGRDPYDHTQVSYDILNIALADILASSKNKILLVTGRSKIAEEETRKWLKTNNVSYDALFMRPLEMASEADYVLKKIIYEEQIKNNYFVCGVFEDREQTTALWRNLNLPVYQVEFGRY